MDQYERSWLQTDNSQVLTQIAKVDHIVIDEREAQIKVRRKALPIIDHKEMT